MGIWAVFCFGGEEAAETTAFCGQSLSCYLLIVFDLGFFLLFFSDLSNVSVLSFLFFFCIINFFLLSLSDDDLV